MVDKRGDLEIKYVILMILALIVLVVVSLVFYFGTTNLMGEFKDIYKDVVTDRPDFTYSEEKDKTDQQDKSGILGTVGITKP